MEIFKDMAEWKPKKLRTLRNNLNNRISSFKNDGEKAKDLQKSHMLNGLDEPRCVALLKEVSALLKNKA